MPNPWDLPSSDPLADLIAAVESQTGELYARRPNADGVYVITALPRRNDA